MQIQGQQMFYWEDQVEDKYCEDPLYHREDKCNCRIAINQLETEYYKYFTAEAEYNTIKKSTESKKSKKSKKSEKSTESKKSKQKTQPVIYEFNKATKSKKKKNIHSIYRDDILIAHDSYDYSGLTFHSINKPLVTLKKHVYNPPEIMTNQQLPPYYSGIRSWANELVNTKKEEYEKHFPKIHLKEESDKCPICLSSLTSLYKVDSQKRLYKQMITTSCNHSFCTDCLERWTNTKSFENVDTDEFGTYTRKIILNNNCPICRNDIQL